MSAEKIDYAAIIADLEAKRAALDNAITSLRALAGLDTIGNADRLTATFAMPFAASGAGEIPDGAFHGKTIPDAIRLYLELMRKKQTAREISDGLKKGGMETTSKWFDKIVYATLDRLKKAREVVRIGSEWGLPQWYPALMRAGVSENAQPAKSTRKAMVRPKKVTKTLAQRIGGKPEPSPSDMVELFLRDNVGAHTPEAIRCATGIKNLKVAMMLLGQLVKKGKVEKMADGKYQKVS